jgi:raffinose/stachyose/melibiose transport system substrate-binding protein
MKKLEPLIKGGDFVDGYNGSKFPAIQQKWAAGEADFLLMGTWAPSETGPSAKAGFQYRSFPLPGATAVGEQAQDIALFGFGVPSKAKHKDAAQKFIAYFLNKERISGLSAQAKNITVRTDVPAPAELADAQKALDANPAVVTLDGVKNTKAEWYTKVFQPANNAFITGRSSAEDFTSKLKSDSAAFWKLQG